MLVVFAACLLVAMCRAVGEVFCILGTLLLRARVFVHIDGLVLGYVDSQCRAINNSTVEVHHNHLSIKLLVTWRRNQKIE